ncbi:MAG: GNAT family N-acetyltransferase [Candidatus Bathyarchaeota archaeon]|nr:MAG: GNAT family N-acetyltransferase [Candidatus Bathyarchaeota archaeon]
MRVKKVDLTDLETTYCCMDEVPPGVSWAETVPESRKWLRNNLSKHVEGYHIFDGEKVVGHIYYASSEKALIPYEMEPKVACIYCTEMLKDYMHKGHGKLMFDYMKKDLKNQGYKGIMIPATSLKEWMHYELFLKQGFRVIMEHPPFYKVMYYPLEAENISIKVIDLNYAPSKEKVEVTLFGNFFCPVGAHMHHLIKRVAQSFGDQVKIVEMESTLVNVRRYGTSEPLINGKIKLPGPASEDDVRKAIDEEIEQFKAS